MMPNFALHSICYTPLDTMTWCATATISIPPPLILWSEPIPPLAPFTITDTFTHCQFMHCQSVFWQRCYHHSRLSARSLAYNKRLRQRIGVRLLLQKLLIKQAIVDSLDESTFPYRLTDSRQYVCFSHSDAQVAVVIGTQKAVGIDIEVHAVKRSLVKRFYHSHEHTLLAQLADQPQNEMAKWLWQLKESYIKVYQYKLACGLGMDYAYLMADISHATAQTVPNDSIWTLVNDTKTGYHIAILPLQQTVVVF